MLEKLGGLKKKVGARESGDNSTMDRGGGTGEGDQ